MPDTTLGPRMKAQRGLARAMKGSSIMRAIGQATTAGMTMIIAGIRTSATATITGMTARATVTTRNHVRSADHIWPNDQVWSALF